MSSVRWIFFLLGFTLLSACASRIKFAGKVDLLNEKLNYPVSFTSYIHTPDGEIGYYKSKDHSYKLKKVGNLKIIISKWLPKRGIDYALKYDVSEKINKQIRRVGGDAIVNFTIIAGEGTTNFYSGNYPLFVTSLAALTGIMMEKNGGIGVSSVFLFSIATTAALNAPIWFKLPSKIEVLLKGDIVQFQN